jgi:hypothetical protein
MGRRFEAPGDRGRSPSASVRNEVPALIFILSGASINRLKTKTFSVLGFSENSICIGCWHNSGHSEVRGATEALCATLFIGTAVIG